MAPTHAPLLKGVRFAWERDGFGFWVDRLALPCGRRELLTGSSRAAKSALLSFAAGFAAPVEGRAEVEGVEPEGLSGPACGRSGC